MLNHLIRYFDLQSRSRATAAQGHAGKVKHAPVMPQYLVVSAGVVVEPFLRNYIESDVWQYEISSLSGRVVFGLIIGLALLPVLYKSTFDPKKPILVQLAALFPMGLGWQSLVTTGTKIGLS